MKRSTNLSITGTRWVFATEEPIEIAASCEVRLNDLSSALDTDILLAGILAARGLAEPDAARRFLEVDPAGLHDPMLLPDMERAVEIIWGALQEKERIMVHGDYDVDGVASCALLQRALSALGGEVETYLPHRISDGYGLGRAAIDQAAARNVSLLITADCGTGAQAEIAYAQSLGMQVVVTDHHLPKATAQDAPPEEEVACDFPEVNPQRADSDYPFPHLSGVGVAFKLVEALAVKAGLPPRAHWRFLDLVALGTVADVSPLVGENRILVKKGLEVIGRTNKVGIRSLMQAARLSPPVSCRQVAFVLAPRLNAAGRLAHPREALELLTTLDAEEAAAIAQALCRHNQARQKEEAITLEQALEQVERESMQGDRVLVLAKDGWHPGVIGIVASRLVERFHRPVVMIALSDAKDGEGAEGVGSARSVDGFHLQEGLHACRDLLKRYGGHSQAAGCAVARDNIEELRARLCDFAAQQMGIQQSAPTLEIDLVARASCITLPAVEELSRLEPFGEANPQPVVLVRGLQVAEMARVGREASHLRLSLLDKERRAPLRTIWFGQGELEDKLSVGQPVDACLSPSVRTWNQTRTIELRVRDLAHAKEKA